ncbi:MAG: hypothetical protein JWM11_4299 [Planctomycetaceae bacterium]|nr:hypothetical protein [Planctomycetaceae bacterium]
MLDFHRPIRPTSNLNSNRSAITRLFAKSCAGRHLDLGELSFTQQEMHKAIRTCRNFITRNRQRVDFVIQ